MTSTCQLMRYEPARGCLVWLICLVACHEDLLSALPLSVAVIWFSALARGWNGQFVDSQGAISLSRSCERIFPFKLLSPLWTLGSGAPCHWKRGWLSFTRPASQSLGTPTPQVSSVLGTTWPWSRKTPKSFSWLDNITVVFMDQASDLV